MFKFVLLLCSLDHRVLGAAVMQMVCGMYVVLCVMCTHVYVIRDTYTPHAAHVWCVWCVARVHVRGCVRTHVVCLERVCTCM